MTLIERGAPAASGQYSYSSAEAGTQAHLAGEPFRLSLGLDLVHIPFNGGGPATDFSDRATALGHAQTTLHVSSDGSFLRKQSFWPRPPCAAQKVSSMSNIACRPGFTVVPV